MVVPDAAVRHPNDFPVWREKRCTYRVNGPLLNHATNRCGHDYPCNARARCERFRICDITLRNVAYDFAGGSRYVSGAARTIGDLMDRARHARSPGRNASNCLKVRNEMDQTSP